MRRIESYDWWPELVRLKDDLSLRELAEKFDVTPGAISAALKRTGTARKPAPPGPRSRRKRTEELPPEPGEVAAGARPGSKDAKILPFADELGKIPDADLAAKAGVSVRTVASFRARHNITGYSGPRRSRNPRSPKRSKIDPYVDLLGTVPDRVVADRAGVSLNAVRNYRVKREIPAAGRRGGKAQPAKALVVTPAASAASAAPAAAAAPVAAAAPAATPPAPTSVGALGAPTAVGAWRVVFTQGTDAEATCIVVAPTLAQAAKRIDDASIGKVLRLEWLDAVL